MTRLGLGREEEERGEGREERLIGGKLLLWEVKPRLSEGVIVDLKVGTLGRVDRVGRLV